MKTQNQNNQNLNQPNMHTLNIPFITAYGPKTKCPMAFPSVGKTKQSFKDECDINVIMSRYMKTGVIDFVNKHQGRYGDVTGLDYQSAMQTISFAQSLFHELPSSVRTRFENDPAQFMDFVHDPSNEAEMHSLGLMKSDYVPLSERQATPIVATPQASPASQTPAEGGTAKA